MKRSTVTVLALGVLCVLVLSLDASARQPQQTHPTWGMPAPALTVELLQSPAGVQATWDSLKGHAVVLEFWATWCPGCVVQIPHLNALTEKFKDRPVRFISITDEDKPVVMAFLLKRPIAGWVGLDSRGVTFNRYGIVGRPLTALIDATGVLRGVVPPTEVQESTIEQLLAGTLQLRQPTYHTPLIGTEPTSPLPLVQTLVRPAMPAAEVGMSPGAIRKTGNRWEAWGVDMRSLLATAYAVPPLRIVLPDGLPRTRYDVSLVLPDDDVESRRAMLRHLVENAFHLSVRREAREMDVFVLRTLAGGVTLQPLAKGRSAASVVEWAEGRLGRVVIDETGLKGTYDLMLEYPESEEALYAAVKALGLSLTPERRPLDLLVAEPAKQ